MDSDDRVFERFGKTDLTATECSDYCTQEPKCGGYRHFSAGSGYCTVLGPGLALPDGWATTSGHSGNGYGVWPIAKALTIARGDGATCYRKIATTTGNNR